MRRSFLASLVVLLLAGCAATPLQQAAVSPPGRDRARFLECLRGNGFLDRTASSLDAVTIGRRFAQGFQSLEHDPVHPGYVHLYLDCYVTYVEQRDIDGRLLRGHMVLALLAQYAAETGGGRPVAGDQADTLLRNIRRAQRYLLAASPSGLEATYGNRFDDADRAAMLRVAVESLPNFRNAQRLAAVLDVAAGIGATSDVQSWKAAQSILSAVINRDIGKLAPLLEQVVATFERAQQLEWYGGAFLRDAQIGLQVRDPSLGGDMRRGAEVWRQWKVRLDRACDALRAQASDGSETCTPGREEVRELIEREHGSQHPAVARLK